MDGDRTGYSDQFVVSFTIPYWAMRLDDKSITGEGLVPGNGIMINRIIIAVNDTNEQLTVIDHCRIDDYPYTSEGAGELSSGEITASCGAGRYPVGIYSSSFEIYSPQLTVRYHKADLAYCDITNSAECVVIIVGDQ